LCDCKKGLSRKPTGPNAAARRPARPSLGKESDALLYWLVLRTAPYKLIVKVAYARYSSYTPASSFQLVPVENWLNESHKLRFAKLAAGWVQSPVSLPAPLGAIGS